ncbi:PRC and DUF2382 domain-containing protein [Kocuria sp. HSID16901]|uniref:PRC and DUF2382 domain-containing protein n=2 Tax=Kocuria TaxID=57493 RepID=UPI0006607B2B|nr:PRC and DUF2382 domain-containing protein [Kocuria sp. HSID16901]RUQ23481.1 DUF2382 domain-containing protein [Kocuria sp. HSID16901]
MTNNQNIESLRNSTVFSNNGDKIGKVGEIYLDDQTNEPTFATVNTGLFGSKETFVPLNKAKATDDGITVPFDKDFVKDAPNIDDDGSLSPEEEQRIYEYYSLDRSTSGQGGNAGQERHDGNAAAGTAAGTAAAGTAAGTAGRRDENVQAGTGRHAQGTQASPGETADQQGRTNADQAAAADNDVVAHEERLRATGQTERREAGQVRLRKHVTTDTETVEVPVRHEEVQVERTKIDPDSAEARQAGQNVEFGQDEDVTVTAYEERPVVTTETVATERVSLNKEARQETESVSGEVRKEEIEIDENGNRR